LRRESEWKQNIHKRQRNSGHEYTASNGQVVERRQLKLHKCGQCANKCNERLSDDARQQIFTNFRSMADRSRQRDFICSHVLKCPVEELFQEGQIARSSMCSVCSCFGGCLSASCTAVHRCSGAGRLLFGTVVVIVTVVWWLH